MITRTKPFRATLLALLLALAGCSGDPGPSGPLGEIDSDGDTISDADELAAERLDTDHDGVLDASDPDSDGDGVLDRDEAGDDELASAPIDSDGDGLPDVRDTDSDANGRSDGADGTEDGDGDGFADFADPDDDDDGLTDAAELGDSAAFPSDTDGDGAPDFRDPDSDDDTIRDGDEGTGDTDGDGTLDRFDDDSDGDGRPDSLEAGDADLATRPIDTDEDGVSDFRDRDADGDGLPDAHEVSEGSDPLDPDSDDDGVGDLVESAAGTDPNDAGISPLTRGDFVFIVPYRDEAEPRRDTLELRTSFQYADVYFLFDTTGSMVEELEAMRSATVDVLDELTCIDSGTPCVGDPECGAGQVCSVDGTCVSDPRVSGCIASLHSGVGVYAGTPSSYRNVVSLQGNSSMTERGIPPEAGGNGGAESLFESVACVADPAVCLNAMCAASGIGCPGFRGESIRVLVTITDETNQCTTGCTVNTAMGAGMLLRDHGILFVAIDADVMASPELDLKAIGRAANSLDASGRPYYARGSSAAVASAVTQTIRDIAFARPIFVTITAEDEAGDDGDARQFVDRLEVNNTASGRCANTLSTADSDGDGFHDSYPTVIPGRELCWDVVVRDNVTQRPTDRPQVFRARAVVRGDDAVLDARNIYFIVPPVVDRPI
ncbi:hypothetical protein [Sandaracinus amylolyticus]|uniref:hypothetical protein n=1 Tax=Sandaracinus amylolyticus TaxID=927083 RepID=UPI001F182425|nr:hypothetical protein [Sandaracinus amylolyticus]UJR86432.1 Hypothetical protein I5071_85270 [Sandaracinus amylolyticus]